MAPTENRVLGSGYPRNGILGLMFEGISYDFISLPLPRRLMPSNLLVDRFKSRAVSLPTKTVVAMLTALLNLRNPIIFLFSFTFAFIAPHGQVLKPLN